MENTETNDWFWDVARQVAVRVDNAGRHDVLIGPYPSQRDAEIWLPTSTWRNDRDSSDDTWVDVDSAYG